MDDGRTRPGILLDDRFLLAQSLGGGGAATVWLAKDLATDQAVAVKLIHPKFRTDDSGRKIIEKEAHALFALSHPSIAKAIMVQLDQAQPYMVLEYVEGTTLAADLRSRTEAQTHFPNASLLAMWKELTDAVGHAHQRGIVHRDLKPPNVMLTGAESGPLVKVLDFGVAKMLGQSPHLATTEGRVQGSIAYMSPEQCIGVGVDSRTDVFALGCMLFETLTLRRCWLRGPDGLPVQAYLGTTPLNQLNNPLAVMGRIASGVRPRVSDFRPDLPKEIDDVIVGALEPHRDKRYASTEDLYKRLASALPGAPAELSESTWVPRPQLTLVRRAPSEPEELATVMRTAVRLLSEPPLPTPVLMPEDRPLVTPTPNGSSPVQIMVAPMQRQGVRTALVFAAGIALGAVAFALAGERRVPIEAVRPEAIAVPAIVPAIAPAPQATALPSVTAPPPVVEERAPPTKKRLAAAPASAEEQPAPVKATVSTIDSMLKEARSTPDDTTLLRRLRDQVGAEADRLGDAIARDKVRRMLASSAMVGDLDGVEKAIVELKKAQRQSP